MKNIKIGPVNLYLLWIVICLSLWLFIPVLSAGTDSSAQAPFVIGIYVIVALILGIFIISILNMFLFREWVKKFWHVNGFIALITGGIILYFIIKMITL
ncbi:hypothetical protein ACSBL2_14190 [Pedobacter sp. AW31-3R]|uniref:hypothetical protein n=1 Tax=Pedobacter sp. AW31-3R TaxID=3445781 RepID=UPI003FA0D433